MAQFDVHRNLAPSKARVPFLLDVQADLLQALATRVVIPLMKPQELGGNVLRPLHVEVEVEGQKLVAVTTELAGIPAKVLGKRVASLSDRRVEIVRSIDAVLTGV